MLAFGIVLMVAGAALLVIEAHVVSYGVLGLAGGKKRKRNEKKRKKYRQKQKKKK